MDHMMPKTTMPCPADYNIEAPGPKRTFESAFGQLNLDHPSKHRHKLPKLELVTAPVKESEHDSAIHFKYSAIKCALKHYVRADAAKAREIRELKEKMAVRLVEENELQRNYDDLLRTLHPNVRKEHERAVAVEEPEEPEYVPEVVMP